MATLTITHSHAEGTLIEGTAKGDGTNEILKANRWRYSRLVGWYVPRSRDRQPNARTIGATAAALREAGHDVTVAIDNVVRDVATVEAERLEREEARAELTATRATNASNRAEAARTSFERNLEALPWGGQPILVGHHSEGPHRNAIARADRSLGTMVQAERDAAKATETAARASTASAGRYEPTTVAIKIDNLSKELHAIRRRITGSSHKFSRDHIEVTPPAEGGHLDYLRTEEERLEGELGYWQGIRAEHLASGQAQDHSRESIKKGGFVQLRRAHERWHKVTRVNPKTVTCVVGEYANGSEWTLTYRYAEITGYQAPQD